MIEYMIHKPQRVSENMFNMKYFIAFGFLLFMALGYKTYEQYNGIKATHKLIILNESKSLANFISAFRQTYQSVFIDNHIEIDSKTINFLPVKTISEISDHLARRSKEDIVIRTVSDRPRNSKNIANDFEMRMMNFFRKNPKIKDKFVEMEDAYYYTKPMYIKESCLKCHGKREETIPSIRDNYDTAYDYKLGDMRGLLNIKIKEKGFFELLYGDFIDTLAFTILMYILFLIIIYMLIRNIRGKEQLYTEKLEMEIQEKVSEIQKQKETFETLFEKSSDGIVIIDDGEFTQCNERAVELLMCHSKNEIINKKIAHFSPKYQPDGRLSREKAMSLISNAIENKGYQFEWLCKRKNKEEFWIEASLTPIVLNNRKVLYLTARDISEKKTAEKKLIEQKDVLYYQAHHDALTGLPNRTLFRERLKHGIDQARANTDKLALFFIDLDEFKQINDSLGHYIGDRVLKVTAERLKANIRDKDTLARLGGDEFVIILESYKKIDELSRLAEKILTVLTQPIHVSGQILYTSCSIGISLYPKDNIHPDNLLKFADAAMYKAKDEGRNNFQFYRSEMTESAFERVIMKTDMRQALENHEFRVYYQPQIDIENGALIGLEALVRWNHPNMGLIPPEKFLELAEENGILVEIDRWVMKMAMRQVKKWNRKGFMPGKLSLNLTLTNLRRDDYIATLQSCLEKHNFDPSNLELEITESEVMKEFDVVIPKLRSVSHMNIDIAIDDFGTGHSSLSYLKKLPVKKLKIDKSFVDDIPENEEDVAIIKTIISLANNLKLTVVAEGVEREIQKDFLFENGCRYIQGHYFSVPLSALEFEKKYFTKKIK